MRPSPRGLALLAALLFAPPARADLTADVERLVRAFSDRAARVERLPPMFLEHGKERTIALAAPRAGDTGCITVAFLGVRTTDFVVEHGERAAPGEEADPLLNGDDALTRLRSSGGTVTLSACGAERAGVGRLRVEMLSPRATLEVVAARSTAPLRPLREVLPERAPGPLAPRGDLGAPLAPRPLAERLARAEKRAQADGAAQVERVQGRALALGVGRFEVELVPGCHRLEVMADLAPNEPRRVPDVDAEARDANGRVLARDRSDLPDARLDLCVGEITPVVVPFVGAGGAVPVVMLRSRWPIPARVPARWGPRARAGFAAALQRRRAPDPVEPPIFGSLGVQGTTTIPFEIEPGRCYLAAVAAARGEPRLLRLSATVGDRLRRDEIADREASAAVSFCSAGEPLVRFDVEARGGASVWALVVWPMGAVSP